MSGFGNFGARAYATVGVETGVSTSSPHALILMLFDGALESLRRAQGCIAAGDGSGKAQAISRTTRIVEEGLRASLDPVAGGDLAAQLSSLYEYISTRTLQASVDNDPAALDEVAGLLEELRSAWAAIQPAAANAA